VTDALTTSTTSTSVTTNTTTTSTSTSLTISADMSKVVKWTFSDANPAVPLVVQSNSAVLTVTAQDDLLARQCSYLHSITAHVHGRHEIVAAVIPHGPGSGGTFR
jgi:hypothetical protein